MSKRGQSGLEKVLSKNPNSSPSTSSDPYKLRLFLLSELELATKLSDPKVLYNVGETIKKYDGRIDAIVINGGIAQVPNKYSKRRGERFDLLEDRLKETYGDSVYKEVKRGGNDSDSVENLEEVVRLARVQVKNIYAQATAKGIPIYYVFSENDYKNVETLIGAIEKLGAYMNKQKDSDEKEEAPEIKGVDSRTLSFIQKSYNFNASDWKNKDKEGIKDIALNIYKQWISSIFRNKTGDKEANVTILKRLENDIEINGVKIRAMHSINGLYAGNNEGKPTERGRVMAIENANNDAGIGRLPDIYLTGHESATSFTAIDFKSRENPVYLMNVGPLQNMESQIRKRASWNRTVESKRVGQSEDSAMVIFSMDNDRRVDIQHVGFRALKDGTDITALERNAAKTMYETAQLSDTHIGAPSNVSSYELMEAVELELQKSNMPRENRFLFLLGDILHGGADKANWTDILWPQRGTYDDSLAKLEKAKTKEQKTEVLRELIYGVALPDLGTQNRQAEAWLSGIAKNFDTAYIVPGNHVQKAAGHASETGFLGPDLKSDGRPRIIYTDTLSLQNKPVEMGPYKLMLLHSPGYRGGVDAGTALMNKVKKTGSDDVDIIMAGDCHEEHAVYAARLKNNTWGSLVAITSAALQDVTTFEKEIVSKNKYTRGFELTYLPKDYNIGTSYIRHRFIPEQALRKTLRENGGSRLERIVKKMY